MFFSVLLISDEEREEITYYCSLMVYGQAWNYFLTILTVTTIVIISHHYAIRSQYFST